jgi:hypothetical protein
VHYGWEGSAKKAENPPFGLEKSGFSEKGRGIIKRG